MSSTRVINRGHQQVPSTGIIHRCHQQASTGAINRGHQQVSSTGAINRRHTPSTTHGRQQDWLCIGGGRFTGACTTVGAAELPGGRAARCCRLAAAMWPGIGGVASGSRFNSRFGDRQRTHATQGNGRNARTATCSLQFPICCYNIPRWVHLVPKLIAAGVRKLELMAKSAHQVTHDAPHW